MNIKIKNISVLGDGAWGTTLAIYLAKKGYPVHLWGAFPENIKRIKKAGINEKFLPGIRIPDKLTPTDSLKEAVEKSELILLATPSQFVSLTLNKAKKFDFRKKIILSVVKGIEIRTLRRVTQIIEDKIPLCQKAVLTGPTIASEVAKGIPSTAVIGARDKRMASNLQAVFNSKSFRVYTNNDIIGLEMGGSLKNIIALACGVCDGLGYGTNAKAAILTRGIVEMARLGGAMGAKKKTFSGLAGLGDLVTTCTSPQSRNRSVGELLGQGKSIKTITASMNHVAEGVATVKAVKKLAAIYSVPMPITFEVYNIIYRNKNPEKAVNDLMSRKMKAE
ncbi:MAG: NAD(P)-dependent glycerol-3-phosphate dehydrogenase [Candidatus Omnitrophica bacterium]|nr:NAD(P)-dependent glycerol-3-phosphate dehydrogenase [Candidatus Omnitrophota bacterium]